MTQFLWSLKISSADSVFLTENPVLLVVTANKNCKMRPLLMWCRTQSGRFAAACDAASPYLNTVPWSSEQTIRQSHIIEPVMLGASPNSIHHEL